MSNIWMSTSREIMSFKLNSILFCGMCIFPIFIGSAPLTDNFKASDFSSTNQSCEILYEETTINYSETGGKPDATINLNDENSADAQQKHKSDERSSILQHEYDSRDLDDEFAEFSAIPTKEYISKPSPIKNKNSAWDKPREHESVVFNGESGNLAKPKPRSKSLRGGKLLSGNSTANLGTPSNPYDILSEIFVNKIFLFSNKNQFNSSLENDKEDIGKTSFFLFKDDLPNPADKFDS